jgi:hypothetical protein
VAKPYVTLYPFAAPATATASRAVVTVAFTATLAADAYDFRVVCDYVIVGAATAPATKSEASLSIIAVAQ